MDSQEENIATRLKGAMLADEEEQQQIIGELASHPEEEGREHP